MQQDSDLIPEMSGANIFLTKGDSILLQLRDDNPEISYPGYWALPGGRTEGSETPEETAVRELDEECGYKMKNPRFIFRKVVLKDNGIVVDEFVFTEEYDNVSPLHCNEGQAIKFIDKDELLKLKVVPWQLKLIEEIVKSS